jgi:2-oxoglutarate dehydrogenase complex dehydrogenase (E1) component-like enzyme
MTHDEHEKESKRLKVAVATAIKAFRAAGTLQAKLDALSAVRTAEAALNEHRLNYYVLTVGAEVIFRG